jgi:membrane protein DedA with SNARE-associated domain
MGNESLAIKIFTYVTGLSGFHAYGVIITVLIVCGLGVPVPEDITLFAAGFLVFTGRITLSGAIAVGIIGVLIGDSFMYWIGRRYGRRVLSWPVFRRMFTPERMLLAESKIQQNARIICFTSRFAPGLRAPIYLTSGILRVPFTIFFVMDSLAALISVPVWVYLAYFLGDHIERLLQIVKTAKIGFGVVIALLLLGFFISKVRGRILSKKL